MGRKSGEFHITEEIKNKIKTAKELKGKIEQLEKEIEKERLMCLFTQYPHHFRIKVKFYQDDFYELDGWDEEFSTEKKLFNYLKNMFPAKDLMVLFHWKDDNTHIVEEYPRYAIFLNGITKEETSFDTYRYC